MGILNLEEDSRKNLWNYQELHLRNEDNMEGDNSSIKNINEKKPDVNSIDKENSRQDTLEGKDSKEEKSFLVFINLHL